MFTFDGTRYRDTTTGRFVSRSRIQTISVAAVEARIEANIVPLAERVASGGMTPQQFKAAMREEIKRAYLLQYELAVGGKAQMTQADYGRLGAMLKKQYGTGKFLDGFIDDIRDGNKSAAYIRNRAALYIRSSRQAYHRADRQLQIANGKNEVRWQTTAAESCETCLAFEALGWQPIGPTWPYKYEGANSFPQSGLTDCRTNCRCKGLQYRKA